MITMDELKPCPFCGEKEKLRVKHELLCIGDYWYVWCLKCEATNGKHSSKAKAIESWNNRAYSEQAVQRNLTVGLADSLMSEIESEPVQHGRWIETGYNPVRDTMYCDCNCSNCNFEITREKGRYPKFCENCGTRMDGGSDND